MSKWANRGVARQSPPLWASSGNLRWTPDVADLVVIFRTHSDIEASIVRGLLEAHDLPSMVSSAVTHSVFPLSVNELGEVRISVHASHADDARRIIDSHRTELPTGRVVRLRDEFEPL